MTLRENLTRINESATKPAQPKAPADLEQKKDSKVVPKKGLVGQIQLKITDSGKASLVRKSVETAPKKDSAENPNAISRTSFYRRFSALESKLDTVLSALNKGPVQDGMNGEPALAIAPETPVAAPAATETPVAAPETPVAAPAATETPAPAPAKKEDSLGNIKVRVTDEDEVETIEITSETLISALEETIDEAVSASESTMNTSDAAELIVNFLDQIDSSVDMEVITEGVRIISGTNPEQEMAPEPESEPKVES